MTDKLNKNNDFEHMQISNDPFGDLRKQLEHQRRTSPQPVRWVQSQFRLFPVWLRIVMLLLVVILAAAGGSMIGYGVIGSGQVMDALEFNTWQHIFDLMNGKQ